MKMALYYLIISAGYGCYNLRNNVITIVFVSLNTLA